MFLLNIINSKLIWTISYFTRLKKESDNTKLLITVEKYRCMLQLTRLILATFIREDLSMSHCQDNRCSSLKQFETVNRETDWHTAGEEHSLPSSPWLIINCLSIKSNRSTSLLFIVLSRLLFDSWSSLRISWLKHRILDSFIQMVEKHLLVFLQFITGKYSHFLPLDDWMFSSNLDHKHSVLDLGDSVCLSDEVVLNLVDTVIIFITLSSDDLCRG